MQLVFVLFMNTERFTADMFWYGDHVTVRKLFTDDEGDCNQV